MAIAGDRATQLDIAVRLLAGLQRLSRRPLAPQLVARSAADDSGAPLLMVGRRDAALRALHPPLDGTKGVLIDAQERSVRLPAELSGAALEAFRDPDGRPVMSLSWTGTAQVARRLIGQIAGYPGAFRGLAGDVAIGQPTGPMSLATVRVDRSGTAPTPIAAAEANSVSPYVVRGAIGFVVLVLGVAAIVWGQRRVAR